jgi:glycosyltransferase involved in cell wall biosynthesis
MKPEIGVLFTHARDQFLAPSQIHGLLMRHLDREHLAVHLAYAVGTGGKIHPSLKAFETIPHLHLRPTQFGPTLTGVSKTDIVRSVICTGPPSIVSLAGLVPYIKRHDIDIIHTEYKPRDAFYGVLLAKLTGIRTIVHVHSEYGDWIGGRVRWAMKEADAIIAISQFVARSVIAAGYPPEKVHYVFNSIDTTLWHYDSDRNLVRREFGLTPEVPLLVIVAGLDPIKGHKLLLEALALVRNQIPDVKLLVVGGEGPSANYISVLKQLTHKLGLDEHVVFTGHRSDIQQILAAADLFTMPSDGEGFGLSFVEAMAMKKPVIGLDNGGTPEVVEHGKSGLLSPAGDVQQLTENILTLVNDPALRQRMGEYGRARVERDFNPQRMANDVEDIYRLVLGHAQASPRSHRK